MTLAPLTTGPHLVPAHRLAFTTPVREAGGAGHWITLHSAEDPESGTCHVWVNGGSGPGSGTIGKGPKSLVGQHIAALASHPSVSKAQHHPVGHEPPGARDHPHYAEAAPKPPVAPGEAGEAAKRPGKPYARLHGADQGTRAEQITKALSEAQGAAKGAKAGAKAQAASGEANPADLSVQAAADHHRAAILAENPELKGHLDAGTGHAPDIERWVNNEARTRLSPQQKAQGGRVLQNAQSYPKPQVPEAGAAKAEDARKAVAEQEATRAGARRMTDAAVERGRKAREKHGIPPAQPHPFEAPEAKVAATAVQAQQAQADLAAHRAKADRNPNPWAPHLSPPVGDAKDRELAEKATRAQMAHQAVVAQQQGAQQQQQAEGQRAHEKDMVRLKAETAVKPLEGKPVAPAASGRQEPPTAKTEKTLFAQPNYLRDHVATRSEMDLRRDAEGLAGMHQQAVKRQIGMERAGDTTSDAYKANAQHAAMLNKHAAAVNDRLEDSRRKSIAGSESELRGPERRGGGPHDTLVHDEPVAKGAFSAPGAKEKPQTAPQPEPLSHARKLHLTPTERAEIAAERKPESHPPAPLTAAPRKEGTLLRDKASPSGKRRVSLEMPTPRPAAGSQSTPTPQQPAAAAPLSGPATPAHAAHEDTLQHLRDHVVARNPVGHSVSPAHVMREMPGATRQEAIAHLDALAQRGVLRQNQHHANFYEVQPGHGASGPGKGDAPAADIRRAQAQAQQTAPQPEQGARAPAPSPQHHEVLREGRRLLAQKALDPQTHKAKLDAAVHKAKAADPYEGAVRGYARHGAAYAQGFAHLEAANHYQGAANKLQQQHDDLANHDKGGALAKAHRHIEALTHHEQRAAGRTVPESDQQARELLARSQAITGHYSAAAMHLAAQAQEHRDAHARLRRTQPVRESAALAPRFTAPSAHA